MALERSTHTLFLPYCLAMGGAGVALLILMTRVWPHNPNLPLFSGLFWILVLFATIFGSLGFTMGIKHSVHVSIGSIFEMALLLSFGPLVTLWVSALSFSAASLIRQLDRVYLRKIPLNWPRRYSLAIMFFDGAMMAFMWTLGGLLYNWLGGANYPVADYLLSRLLFQIVLIALVNHYANALFVAIFQYLRNISSISEYFLKESPFTLIFELATVPLGVLLAAAYQQMGVGVFLWFLVIMVMIGLLLRTHSNTRLHLENRLAELRLLNKLGRATNSTLNMTELLEQIYRETTQLLEVSSFAIGLYDAQSQQITFPLAVENGVRYERQVVKLGEGIASHIIHNKQTVHFHERAQLEASNISYLRVKNSIMPESYLGVPLIIGDEVLGVLTVQHERAHAFDNHQVQLLTTMAAQLANALRNARMYAELEKSFHAMREVSRLKDEFLNSISHELRTPLTVIIGWGELMALGRLSEEQLNTAVDQINRSSGRLLQLVNSLLDLSKIEQGLLKLDLHETNIHTPVQRAVDENMIEAVTKSIQVRCEFAEQLPTVRIDSLRIQQVVSNLLSNAIKFTAEGGLVVVRSEQRQQHIQVSVIDNGIGIDHAMLPYIFERFRQIDGSTTRKYGGVGIGLSLVKRLIEMHGGMVLVDSELGKGSTFSLMLPLTNTNANLAMKTSPVVNQLT
ncbi:MAG: GAF domain-containing sensor histidine kinase [Acidobacteriota bacterium]